MKIIDTHLHAISADQARYPTAPIGGHQSTWSRDRPVDAAGVLNGMKSAGIAKAVVVQASTVYGHDNRYVSDVVRAHPERFVGVYSIDAMRADAPEEIDRWQAAGLSGFRLFTTGSTMPGQADWLGHQDSYGAWAHAQELGICICLQMTMEGLPALRKLLARFPRSKVLLDHCARPTLSDGAPYRSAAALFEMAEFPGVFLKLTNRTLAAAAEGKSRPETFLDKLVSEFGADRIAWGSNFPAAEGSLSELLNAARTALSALPAAVQAQIFAKTAEALYPALALGPA